MIEDERRNCDNRWHRREKDVRERGATMTTERHNSVVDYFAEVVDPEGRSEKSECWITDDMAWLP